MVSARVTALCLTLCSVTAFADSATAVSGLSASASCTAEDRALVQWTFYDDPAQPTDFPAWVGYVVARLNPTAACEDFAPVSPVIPRGSGPVDPHSYLDSTALPGARYIYWVMPVDANGARIDVPGCDCRAFAFSHCPVATTPAAHGTIVDWGWTLALNPCSPCGEGGYFEGPTAPQFVEELRPYAGTGIAVRLYGQVGCCSVEGSYLLVERYEFAECGATATDRATWGRVKARYR